MKNLVTIKLNKEFKRAYFQGKYKPHPLLVTYMVKNRLGYNRVGITTSKKIGKAVQRNRCRRMIRAAYAAVIADFEFSCGYDIVFVARAQTHAAKSTQLEPVIKKHFQFLTNALAQPQKRKPQNKKQKEQTT